MSINEKHELLAEIFSLMCTCFGMDVKCSRQGDFHTGLSELYSLFRNYCTHYVFSPMAGKYGRNYIFIINEMQMMNL